MLSVILARRCVESNFLWLIQGCKGSWINLAPQRIPVMQFDPKTTQSKCDVKLTNKVNGYSENQ